MYMFVSINKTVTATNLGSSVDTFVPLLPFLSAKKGIISPLSTAQISGWYSGLSRQNLAGKWMFKYQPPKYDINKA